MGLKKKEKYMFSIITEISFFYVSPAYNNYFFPHPKAMNFQGRLKFLHGQNKKGKDGATLSPQLALFAVATPLQPPSILEIRTKNFIFRTKHKLDFTPTGCDAK